MNRDELISILKVAQWQKCKGELLAFLALEDSLSSSDPQDIKPHSYLKLQILIYDLIFGIERSGLHK